MKRDPLYTVLTLGLLLTGCATHSPSSKPDVLLPERYTAEGTANPDNADASTTVPTAIDRAWWTHFNDPLLTDIVTKSLAHNADLQAAIARIEAAAAAEREVGGAQWPRVNAEGHSSRSKVSQAGAVPLPSSAPAIRNTHRLALTTSFEIDLFGRLRHATQAAREELLATQYAHDNIRLTLIGLVAQQYFALRAADAQLAILTQLRARQHARHTLIRHRHEAGLISALDVHQSEAALATVDVQLAAVRQSRALAEHQLATLTGSPGLTIPAGNVLQLPVPVAPPAGLPSALLEARPDIQQAEAALKSMQARLAFARAAYFPVISLTGSLGGESKSLSDIFSRSANIWSLGLDATLAVFDAGRNAAREDQANARQQEALANYVKAVQTAFQDVNDALITLRESTTTSQANTLRTEAAQKAFELTEYRYQAGYVGYIDVLEAQQRVLEAQQTDITARQNQLSATVSLFKALGGGWGK